MREKARFSLDIGRAADAMMGKTKDITFAVSRDDEIDVVEAAMEHSATRESGDRIVTFDEPRHGVRPRRRVEWVKIQTRTWLVSIEDIL
jgi:hypothetical protein